eukprot:357233-Chlamydomonas_euryale.AAC.2
MLRGCRWACCGWGCRVCFGCCPRARAALWRGCVAESRRSQAATDHRPGHARTPRCLGSARNSPEYVGRGSHCGLHVSALGALTKRAP